MEQIFHPLSLFPLGHDFNLKRTNCMWVLVSCVIAMASALHILRCCNCSDGKGRQSQLFNFYYTCFLRLSVLPKLFEYVLWSKILCLENGKLLFKQCKKIAIFIWWLIAACLCFVKSHLSSVYFFQWHLFHAMLHLMPVISQSHKEYWYTFLISDVCQLSLIY